MAVTVCWGWHSAWCARSCVDVSKTAPQGSVGPEGLVLHLNANDGLVIGFLTMLSIYVCELLARRANVHISLRPRYDTALLRDISEATKNVVTTRFPALADALLLGL